MVIIDTSIIIDHLRQTAKETHLMRLVETYPKETLAISMISVQELYEGKSTKDPQKEQALLATISPLRILPYTFEVAKRAGELARERLEPIELADAAIAATALTYNASLFTLNKRDFEGLGISFIS